MTICLELAAAVVRQPIHTTLERQTTNESMFDAGADQPAAPERAFVIPRLTDAGNPTHCPGCDGSSLSRRRSGLRYRENAGQDNDPEFMTPPSRGNAQEDVKPAHLCSSCNGGGMLS